MRRKVRVAHLITRLELGGAQQNTLFCMRHHDRHRFEVELIAGRGGMLDDEARNLPDAAVHLVPWLVHPISPLRDLVAVLRLRSLLRQRQIDVVHTHSSKAGIVGRAAALLAGTPVIVHTVHGWSFNETQGWLTRRLFVWLERLSACWSRALVVVSTMNREKGLAEHVGRPEQYTVLHSGIDIRQYERPSRKREEVRSELGFESDHFVVGCISNFKAQKAPLDFVEAAAAAHAENPSLRFFMAGDGPLREATEARIRELDLTNVIRLLGWRLDVVDLLHAMDLFLLTSLFEGLPRTVLQAMAAGVPVVATEVDGTPEVVHHRRTGMLIPPGRPDEAARAVLEMAQDEALRKRCAANAGRRLGQQFDIHRMVEDLDELYASWF